MGLTSWLRNRIRNRASRAPQRPAAPRFRPRLEALEERWLPSTLSVTTALDVVDPNDGVVSLREAISDAQSGDTIRFSDSLSGKTKSGRACPEQGSEHPGPWGRQAYDQRQPE